MLPLWGCWGVYLFVFSCFRVCVCHAFRTRDRTFVLTSCCQRIEYRVFRSIPWVRINNRSYRTNEMYYEFCHLAVGIP